MDPATKNSENTASRPRTGEVRLLRVALFLMLGLLGAAGCGDAPKQPHIVLISVDTLRADHLEPYGYERPTSPNLKALADSGLLFLNAQSQAPWTLPSMASVHTSLYPREHGANTEDASIDDRSPALAKSLSEAGYRTVAVVSHYFINSLFGFSRGFDVFDETEAKRPEHAVNSPKITEIALEHFGDGGTGPTFLWVHYFDPHQDWVRHPEIGFSSAKYDDLGDILRPPFVRMRLKRDLNAGEIKHLIDVYDEEIAFTDRAIGELIDGLRAATDDPIVFAFTADHGELLMERGRFGHGIDLHAELVHVPLILGGDIPVELRGTASTPPVETRSLPKTLLGFAGAPSDDFDGVDLLQVARGGSPPAQVFSEGSTAYRKAEKRSVTTDGFKMIIALGGGPHFGELYDLRNDPGEQRNLWRNKYHRPRKVRMLQMLEGFDERQPGRGKVVEIDDEEKERLKALGYFEEEGEPPGP